MQGYVPFHFTMTTTPPDYTTTSLDLITVLKDKLLTKLRENRQRHDEIFKAACEGFWVQARQQLDEKKTEFTAMLSKAAKDLEWISTKATTDFDKSFADFGGALEAKDRKPLVRFPSYSFGHVPVSFQPDWTPAYPVEHLADYDRAISKLEFSVADKVSLSAEDFDAYVLNNWSWKAQFSASNSDLIKCVTGFYLQASGASFLTSAAYQCARDGTV